MQKSELITLIVFGHKLRLLSFALLSVLRVNELEVNACTFGQAVNCLVDHIAFVPGEKETATLVEDVVALFEKLV